MKQEDFIQDLTQKVNFTIEEVNQLKKLPQNKLLSRKEEKSWNALECIEHLNRYSDFYIKEFTKKVESANKGNGQKEFKSGFLGGYFAKSMLPTKGMRSMKTFADKNPLNDSLTNDVLDQFLQQQNQLLMILKKAKEVDLSKTKCNLTLPLIKLKLGDAFKFYIHHNLRHIEQAKKATSNA